MLLFVTWIHFCFSRNITVWHKIVSYLSTVDSKAASNSESCYELKSYCTVSWIVRFRSIIKYQTVSLRIELGWSNHSRFSSAVKSNRCLLDRNCIIADSVVWSKIVSSIIKYQVAVWQILIVSDSVISNIKLLTFIEMVS